MYYHKRDVCNKFFIVTIWVHFFIVNDPLLTLFIATCRRYMEQGGVFSKKFHQFHFYQCNIFRTQWY